MKSGDEALIQGFLRGELAAVAQLQRWVSAAASPFRRRLASHWDDLRQDVLLELTRLFIEERFRGDSALVSYVWRVTANACLHHLRRSERWRPEVEEVLLDVRDTAQTPAERLLEEDRLKCLQRLAARMTEECRDLWRRIVAGHSYQQMSADLGVAEGVLRVRVLRCRRRASALRAEEEGE